MHRLARLGLEAPHKPPGCPPRPPARRSAPRCSRVASILPRCRTMPSSCSKPLHLGLAPAGRAVHVKAPRMRAESPRACAGWCATTSRSENLRGRFLEQAGLVGHREAPLLVVVARVERVARRRRTKGHRGWPSGGRKSGRALTGGLGDAAQAAVGFQALERCVEAVHRRLWRSLRYTGIDAPAESPGSAEPAPSCASRISLLQILLLAYTAEARPQQHLSASRSSGPPRSPPHPRA